MVIRQRAARKTRPLALITSSAMIRQCFRGRHERHIQRLTKPRVIFTTDCAVTIVYPVRTAASQAVKTGSNPVGDAKRTKSVEIRLMGCVFTLLFFSAADPLSLETLGNSVHFCRVGKAHFRCLPTIFIGSSCSKVRNIPIWKNIPRHGPEPPGKTISKKRFNAHSSTRKIMTDRSCGKIALEGITPCRVTIGRH